MLGFVSYNADDQISNITKEEIFGDICVLLAGRVSKIKKFGKKGIDSGAVDDLSQATFQAYTAIANLGMDEELGFINIDSIATLDNTIFSSKIEERVLKWIEDAKKRTEILIEENWEKIEKLAKLLIEKEIVEADELEKIISS